MKTWFAWIFVCVIWSTVWLFIKVGVTEVPPLSFAVTRLLIALGILAPIVWRRTHGSVLTWSDRRIIAVTGVMLFTVNYALLYWAAQYVSSGLMAVLQAITPAFALLVAQWHLPDERITLPKALGLAIGFAGVSVIFLDELEVSGRLRAVACAATIASAFMVAWGYVLARARGSHVPTTAMMAGQIGSGLVPLFALTLISEGNPLAVHWTPIGAAAVIYLAIAGSIVAFWLNYWLMKRIGATRMLLTSILEPLLAVLLGAIVLGERLTSRVGLGGALVLISVALVMKRDNS